MKELEPYQQRVITEKEDLDARLAKLDEMLNSEHFKTLSTVKQDHLREQAKVMKEYSDILGKRIEDFTNEVRP